MWKKYRRAEQPQMTIWRMLTACWVTKATNTLSEYVILIAFTLLQCLQNAFECYVIRTLCEIIVKYGVCM